MSAAVRPHVLKINKEQEQYLVALREAAARRDRARSVYDESRVAVNELVLGAFGVGVGGSAVARAAGISRQRAYQMLDEAKAS